MSSASPKRLLQVLLVLLGIVFSTAPACAGVFNVKPIRLFMSKDASSVILTIHNEDSAPLRIQVGGASWNNNRDGQPQLKPTDDLIVFPTLITMNPFEERIIRIGFSGTPPSNTELTYRITIDELPSLESQIGGAHNVGLQVRTRITVPVFFEPDNTFKKAGITALSVHRGIADATFTNEGNFHVVVGDVDIAGRDEAGNRVFSKTVQGWYVLAGEARDFQAAIPRGRCTSVKSVSVTVHTDVGAFTRTALVNPDCH
jgi:fimbrial chaperone protein